MPSRTSRSPGADSAGSELGQERLLSAAVRLAGELPTARAVVGILSGRDGADHDLVLHLRQHLTRHGIRGVDVSPTREADRGRRESRARQRPRVHFLLDAGGSLRDHALRAAALWDLPLLIERPPHQSPSELISFSAHRRDVIGIHLPGGDLDIAVRQATITSLLPHAGSASLLLDNEKITAPAEQPLRIDLTAQGSLLVHSDAFATRRVRRLRYARPWGAYRLDIDGNPALDVRAPLRLEPMPGRLHLLHP